MDNANTRQKLDTRLADISQGLQNTGSGIALLALGSVGGEPSRRGVGAGLGLGARGRPGGRAVGVRGAMGGAAPAHDVDVPAATAAAVRAGVWIRPFRNLVYTMPPYVCSDDDVARIAAALDAAAAAG